MIFIIEQEYDYFKIQKFETDQEAIDWINDNPNAPIEEIIRGETLDLEKVEVVTKYEFKKQS